MTGAFEVVREVFQDSDCFIPSLRLEFWRLRDPCALVRHLAEAVERINVDLEPLPWSADTNPHSAHRPNPYEAFSTLQPVTTLPSSTSAAAPTGNPE